MPRLRMIQERNYVSQVLNVRIFEQSRYIFLFFFLMKNRLKKKKERESYDFNFEESPLYYNFNNIKP